MYLEKLVNAFLSKQSKLIEWLGSKNKAEKRKRELKKYLELINPTWLSDVEENLAYVNQLKSYYKSNFRKESNYKWSVVYAAMSGVLSTRYVPHDVYIRRIEKQLNHMSLAPAFFDKNSYDVIFSELNRPLTYLRVNDQRLLDKNYKIIGIDQALEILSKDSGKKICKPSLFDSGAGKGIQFFSNSDAEQLLKNKIRNGGHFIIQEIVNQHKDIAKLHPSSLNLLKILTCRVGNEIKVVSSLLRVGKNERNIDSNGYFAGIDENGVLKIPVMDSSLNKVTSHEDTGESFEGFKVPSYEQATKMCASAHEKLIYFDLVSWDIAINGQSQPTLIEINVKSQGIDKYQMANGPLLGEYTDEIMNNLKL